MASQITGSSEVAVHVYQALYGQAPGNALYTSYIAQIGSTDGFAWANQMASGFSSLSDSAFATLVLGNMGISATTLTASTIDATVTGAVAYTALQGALTNYLTAAGLASRGTVVAQLSEIVSNLAGTTDVYGAAATTYNTQALADFNHATTAGSVSGVAALPDATVGTTYVLTTSPNTLTGGAANDTFDGGAVVDSLSAFDSLNGGGGVNTLNANLTGVGLAAALTISNIQSATLATTAGGFTADVSGWTGLTSLKLSDSTAGAIAVTAAATTAATIIGTGVSSVRIDGGGVSANVTTGAGAVDIGKTGAAINAFAAVTVAGGSTVDISDNKTAVANSGLGTTLTSVSITGNTSAATVLGKGVTTVNYGGTGTTNQSLTITNGTASHTQNLTLNKVTGGTIADAVATTLNVTTTGTASSAVTLSAADATAVNLVANAKMSLTALTAAAAETVGISGASAVVITGDTLDAAAVITSTNTGGVTLTQALTAGQQFVGTASSGADKIGVGATTVAITTGAGNDTVTFSAAAVGTGGSIAAGDGTGDTLSMTSANAATASSSAALGAAFVASVTGFEKLVLTGVGATVDVSKLGGFTDISYSTGTNVLDGVTTGSTIDLTALLTSITVNTTTALTAGTADVLNVIATAAGATAFGTVALTAVETVNVTATDSTTLPLGTVADSLTLTDAVVKTITVAGNAGLTLVNTSTTVTSLSAAGMTGSGTEAGADALGLTWVSGVLAAASTVTGSSAVDVITMSATSKAVTLNGGLGGTAGLAGDTLIGGGGADTITFSGLGNATLTGNGGADKITGSTGDDTISGGAGNDTIVGGGGVDIISGGAGVDVITVSGITSTLKQTSVGDSGPNTSTTIQTSELTSAFDVVHGWAAGDSIDFGTAPALGWTMTLAAINLAGADNTLSFARGTYDALAGTFTYSAVGADTALTYDVDTAVTTGTNNMAFETIILVGYVTGATPAPVSGLLAFA